MIRVFRYLVFAIFIIGNAIVASVAVWNHSLASATAGWSPRFDIYLIFLGCFGLVHIFTVIFIELAWRHGITGRVWFECLWVGSFAAMYLAGASATTAILQPQLCHLSVSHPDTCASTRVLLAFTWAMAAILLSYFIFLLAASILHYKNDPRIFHHYVHKFPTSLPIAPVSPPFQTFLKKMPSVVAPKPQRPLPAAVYNHHAGLPSEYDVESYMTPVHHTLPLPPSTPPLTLPSTVPPISQHLRDDYVASAFYPRHIQSAINPRSEQAPPTEFHYHAQSHQLPPQRTRQLQLHHPPHGPPRTDPLPSSPLRPFQPAPSSYHIPRPPLHPLPRPPAPIPVSVRPPPPAPPPARVTVTRNTSFPPREPANVTRNTSFPPRARPSGPRHRSNESRAVIPGLSSVVDSREQPRR